MNTLEKLRREIDKIDQKLLADLAKRFKITQKVGEYKKKHNLPALDKAREKKILERNKTLAKKLNLDPILIEKIFKLIFKKVRQIHQKIRNERK